MSSLRNEKFFCVIFEFDKNFSADKIFSNTEEANHFA